MKALVWTFNQEKGLLCDCENRWMVCSSTDDTTHIAPIIGTMAPPGSRVNMCPISGPWCIRDPGTVWPPILAPATPGSWGHNWDWSLSLTAQNKLSNLIQTMLWSVMCSAINGNISQMYWVHIFKNLYILETTAMCNQVSVSCRMVLKKSFKILNRF